MLTKRIQLNYLFKISCLNSNFQLTLGYVNPALNNWAQYENRPRESEIWWRPLELKTFQKWKKFCKRKRTNSNHVCYRIRHNQSQAKALVLSAILNTWLPRPNFIYSNNTLLTAGCCEPELYRYLKHWYCLLCPGPVKPILLHSFGRSWYMRLFHTPRTSFLLTTRLWKHTSFLGFIFIPRKNLRAPSRAFLNSSLRLCPYGLKASMKNFNGFSWPIALLVFTCGRWRQGLLCVIQSLPHPDFGCVTRFAEWFCVRPSFLFPLLLSPPSKICSTLAP